MNLVDCYVTKVLGEPVHRHCYDACWWQVPVEYNSWGTLSKTDLVFKTKEAADKVVEGYHFLA